MTRRVPYWAYGLPLALLAAGITGVGPTSTHIVAATAWSAYGFVMGYLSLANR